MKKRTYSEALKELEEIISKLESDTELNMDELTKEVKDASELLAFCKKELTEINEKVEKMIDDI